MPLILSGNVASATAGAYEVANSVIYNDGDSPKMQKTIVSGSNTIGTFSCWVKRSTLGTDQALFTSTNDTLWFKIWFHNEDYLRIDRFDGTTPWLLLKNTSMKFRDPGAWYHIHVALDSTDGTAEDRMILTVNGVRVTSFALSTNLGEDDSLLIGEADYVHRIGANQTSADFFDGYMAEVVWIDGTASAATNFGEFDEDSPTIWKPKDVSGLSLGTNGYYLDFEASDNLGNDANGGTDFTESNLAAVDQTTDTPTNNFCTLSPIMTGSYTTLSNGSLTTTGATAANNGSSLSGWPFPANGKWYFEIKMTDDYSGSASYPFIGFFLDFEAATLLSYNEHGYVPGFTHAYVRAHDTTIYATDGNITSQTAIVNGDIIQFAADMDNEALYIGINGTFQNSGDPTSGGSKTGAICALDNTKKIVAVVNDYSGSDTDWNFGNPPYANSSDAADADGYGAFEYAPPSGYFALCTKNLAEYG